MNWGLLIVLLAVLLLAGFTARQWAPHLIGFISSNAELIQAISSLVQLVIWFIAGLIFILALIFRSEIQTAKPTQPDVPLSHTPTKTLSPTISPTSTHSITPSATLAPSVTSTPTSSPPPSPVPTPTIDYTANGFCDEVEEPCYYLPIAGDSWPTVAVNSIFEDSCRWPDIANLNRRPDGTYRNIGPLLIESGIFIPPLSKVSEYNPENS
jgi:hypothetical protein